MATSHEAAQSLLRIFTKMDGCTLTIDIDVGGLDEGRAFDVAAVYGDHEDCQVAEITYGGDDMPATVHVVLRRDWIEI